MFLINLVKKTFRLLGRAISTIFIWIIKGYQLFVSPVLPSSCRFYPTCSNYSIEAIKRFGPVKGGYLSVKRVIRCNPWNPGGYDPVPEKKEEKNWKKEHC